ncbi:MAG: pre-peptidase C-terminal domain-containing protein, partial [Sulfurovum sp.]|nr:pre-peptidase C-terminal domain-containing protein [Sulfurovum sp.]
MKTYLRHLAIAIAIAMATVAVMIMLDACDSETSIGNGDANAGKDTNGVVYRRVTSKTGRIWLDRNLGASQVATSPSDEASYGDYFQWGRPADGHQRFDSPNIGSVQANTISPSSNNRFITIDTNTADWVRSGVDDNGTRREAFLQKTDGTGICPQGYRVPTVAEWRAELDASSQDMSNSTLKLPLAGFRDGRTGKVNRTTSSTNNPNAVGYYLASDSSSQKLVKFLFLDQNRRGKIETKGRAYGYSVRCIEAQNGEKAPGAAPSDDHSNSKDEATPINPNSITPGSIETAGDVDWFKIVIPSRGTLVVKTTGTIDTAGELYDASGRHRIAYDDDGGIGRNFKITQTVTAGTYYVEVRHRASGTGIYALSTIFTSAPASTPTTPVSDDYGNTASTARTISPTSIISGNIETAGDVDWFKVVIPRRGTLVATLSSPTDIDVSLYNVSNIHIASEDSSGSSISQSITAGTYYVKVRHHSST